MPSAPHLGMGRLSISSPSISNANANSTAATVASDDPAPAPSSSASPSAPSSSSRPSFLSRLNLPLSLPLRGRNRNVADFHVRPEEPYKKYSAGDSVRGAVVLVIVKPVRITHLVVSLHGYVRVRKDPSNIIKAQGATTLPQGGGASRPRYHGNGFASLFQDEQVLSGAGRLEPGKYEFGFDLIFPEKDLPSSIDFERGTISYMITATLTRPTTITPTASCDRKVLLVEKVDIGLLQPPRPRTIFLEPISKRTRRKKSMVLEKAVIAAPETNELGSEADSVDPSALTALTEDPHNHTITNQRSPIQSDMRSDVSGESGLSASTGVSRAELALSQVGTLTASAKQQAVDDRTITATIELLKGGCLPGDTVSVRVTVQHIKRFKSMTGVIVTLFRQGKIDTSPPASMFEENASKEDLRRADKEDVYPRSRTGLGGLSLSSSSSTSVFRKDLDQNLVPLIVDPVTLQTSVTVSVKMPDDSFPTIKGVPGEMISFKYQVEVVVDLGGRLANQFQGVQTPRFGSFGQGSTETSSNTYSPRRGANMADTTLLRHEKGVISVSMETVVGTVDSSRGRKRSTASPSSRRFRITESDDEEAIRPEMGYREEIPYEPYQTNGQFSSNPYQTTQQAGNRYPPAAHLPQPYIASQNPHHWQPSQPGVVDYAQANSLPNGATPEYIPPPQIPNQNELSDKERVRQAETMLLPSQPAAAGPSSSGNDNDIDADADAGDNIYDAEDTPRVPSINAGSSPQDDVGEGPSAPTQDELFPLAVPPAEPPAEQDEDKQELERRRLLNEASAPPEFPEDMERRNGGPSTREMPPDANRRAHCADRGRRR
ncbi:hypothetical protein G7046_g10083 [Stylonectria norvegica]|nr:hypothetical protein G7046_g10083 [Stylonectria norvegica]